VRLIHKRASTGQNSIRQNSTEQDSTGHDKTVPERDTTIIFFYIRK
jgi:hypothetical protein